MLEGIHVDHEMYTKYFHLVLLTIWNYNDITICYISHLLAYKGQIGCLHIIYEIMGGDFDNVFNIRIIQRVTF